MQWMTMPLKRYADFSGRSRRLEYWMFTLFITIVGALWGLGFFLFVDFGGHDLYSDRSLSGLAIVWGIIGLLAYLAILVPAIAVQVRRFHDQDRTGWLVLLNFIPYIGGLIVLVFMFLPGTQGENRFGEDPKDPGGVEDAARVFS